MRIVRKYMFETNSSSTHVVVICTEEEFKKFKNGELFYYTRTGELCEKPEWDEISLRKSYFNWKAQKLDNGYVYNNRYYKSLDDLIYDTDNIKVSQEELESEKNEYEYEDYWEFNTREDMEYSEKRYTSPSGDKLVVFGYGGYDG